MQRTGSLFIVGGIFGTRSALAKVRWKKWTSKKKQKAKKKKKHLFSILTCRCCVLARESLLAGLEEATEHILQDATMTEVLELHLRVETKDALEGLAIVHLDLNLDRGARVRS